MDLIHRRLHFRGEQLGPELITNGTFDSSGSWVLVGTNASIVAGTLRLGAANADNGYRQSLNTTIGTYKYSITVSSYVSGHCIMYVGNASWESTGSKSGNNTFTGYITTTANNTNFYVTSNASGSTMYIDNVSLKRVL